MTSQTTHPQHFSLIQPNDIHTLARNESDRQTNHASLINHPKRQLATSYLTLLGPNNTTQPIDTDSRLRSIKQPVHSKYINVTMNPYNPGHEVVGDTHMYERDGMLATQYLRDSVYMNPKLMQLTNTLRRGKKVCQGGHSPEERPCSTFVDSSEANTMTSQPIPHQNDSTMLPESEVVFRAVSPHGHVYWEIDPTRSQTINISKANTSSYHNPNPTMSYSYASEPIGSPFSGGAQSNKKLIEGKGSKIMERQTSNTTFVDHTSAADSMDARPTILVNPFADINMIAQCQSPSKSSTSTNITTDGSSLNVSPAQLRNMKSLSRFNSPRSKSKSEDKEKTTKDCQNMDGTNINSTNDIAIPSINSQKPQEPCSYASNSVSSTSTSTTSASSSLSNPSKPNDSEPTQRSIPILKDVKMSIPPVSLKGKDFFMSKIQSHMANGASGMRGSNKDASSLANNMDSFLSSLSGSQRKNV